MVSLTRPRASSRGFTLVELLVVLVILGSLVGLAVLGVSDPRGRQLRDEAERLSGLLALLSEAALLDNREYGLLVNDQGYRVQWYDEASAAWQDSREYRQHRLPASLRLQLQVEGQALQLANAVTEEAPDNPLPAPQLLLLSSGELSSFSLQLQCREPGVAAWELRSDGFQLPIAQRLEQR